MWAAPKKAGAIGGLAPALSVLTSGAVGGPAAVSTR